MSKEKSVSNYSNDGTRRTHRQEFSFHSDAYRTQGMEVSSSSFNQSNPNFNQNYSP